MINEMATDYKITLTKKQEVCHLHAAKFFFEYSWVINSPEAGLVKSQLQYLMSKWNLCFILHPLNVWDKPWKRIKTHTHTHTRFFVKVHPKMLQRWTRGFSCTKHTNINPLCNVIHQCQCIPQVSTPSGSRPLELLNLKDYTHTHTHTYIHG